jgi:CspA family cold shock protein
MIFRLALKSRRAISFRAKDIDMHLGAVKFYNGVRGFGFIQSVDGGAETFVHASVLDRGGMIGVVEGQKVEYDWARSKRPQRRGQSSRDPIRSAFGVDHGCIGSPAIRARSKHSLIEDSRSFRRVKLRRPADWHASLRDPFHLTLRVEGHSAIASLTLLRPLPIQEERKCLLIAS